MTDAVPAHVYLSTACAHGECGSCRQRCKFCPSTCTHDCHPQQPGQFPVANVDQARDTTRALLAVMDRSGVNLAALDPDLHRAITHAPALFWARGEEAPPGEWQPPTY